MLVYLLIYLKVSEIRRLSLPNTKRLAGLPGRLGHHASGKYHPHKEPELARGTLCPAPLMPPVLLLLWALDLMATAPALWPQRISLSPLSSCHQLEYNLGQVYLTGKTLFPYLKAGLGLWVSGLSGPCGGQRAPPASNSHHDRGSPSRERGPLPGPSRSLAASLCWAGTAGGFSIWSILVSSELNAKAGSWEASVQK